MMTALIIAVVSGFSRTASAQTASCDDKVRAARQSWGASSHSWFASVLHNEAVGISETRCRIFETSGADRVSKAEDFGRALFTGEGIHPVVGTIVPGSGLAAGASLNLERALVSKPLRTMFNAEARRSTSGFWEAGAQLVLNGSGETDENRHINAIIAGRHQVLPSLPHFGFGNSSAVADERTYGLRLTAIGGQLNVPVPGGFALSTGVEHLAASSTGGLDLALATDHLVFGGGIGWRYPIEERLRGYRTNVRGQWRLFHAVDEHPASFRRMDAEWIQVWSPDTQKDPGELTVIARFTGSMAGDRDAVPFYLQPTLGGSDINGTASLRSFRDYRFRAPNALAFTIEYEHALGTLPLGLWVFADAGQVAERGADFDLAELRKSYGIGMTLHAGGSPVVKLYFAWGGGEGSHTTFTGNSNGFGPEGSPRGVF
jgi:hypothetical protein